MDPVCACVELQSLHLQNNRLRELSLQIGQLRALRHLMCSNNRLSELPTSIGALVRLESLDVENNRLSHLPLEIGGLDSLKLLNCSTNQLVELPRGTAHLSVQLKLLASRNPLQRPPLEVVRQGMAAIRRYFYDIEKGPGLKSSSVRCVLLGDTGAGKTSLQRALRSGEPWATSAEEGSTLQLDVYSTMVGKGAEQHRRAQPRS